MNYSAVFVYLLVSCLFSFTQAAEIPIYSQRSLRQQVDLYVELLEKETSKAKVRTEKISVLKRVSSQVEKLTKAAAPAAAEDLLYSEILLAGLNIVPPVKKFKAQDCNAYENQMERLAEFWKHAETSSEALQPAKKFLQTVCVN